MYISRFLVSLNKKKCPTYEASKFQHCKPSMGQLCIHMYIYIYIYINASLTCQHECISQLYLHISLTLGSEAIHTDSIPAFQEWSQQTSCRPTLLSSCGNTIVVELIVLRLPRIGLNAGILHIVFIFSITITT